MIRAERRTDRPARPLAPSAAPRPAAGPETGSTALRDGPWTAGPTPAGSGQPPARPLEVHVPSIEYPAALIGGVAGLARYDSRQLSALIGLGDRDRDVLFVTSNPVPLPIVDYYLDLKPSAVLLPERERRARVTLLSPKAGAQGPLAVRVLGDRGLRSHLKRRIAGREVEGLSVFTNSQAVDTLAKELKLPVLEAPLETLYFGTKQGSREIFRRAGVPHPAGVPRPGDEDLLEGEGPARGRLARPDNLARAIARALEDGGEVASPKWLVKLNDGFSGKGNAVLDLGPVLRLEHSADLTREERIARRQQAIEARLEAIEVPDGVGGPKEFFAQVAEVGAVAEVFREGDAKTFPSALGYLPPGGGVEVLATHEQRLSGQTFKGCAFPADAGYRREIQAYTAKVGAALREAGVIGHFGVDYLVTPGTPARIDALEINLRQSGTSHPFDALARLTGGRVDADGTFRLADGHERTYVATDNLQKAEYRNLTPEQVLDAVRAATDLHWDPKTQQGVVVHLLPLLPDLGKLGYTAIAPTLDEAEALAARLERRLDSLARPKPPPGAAG